MHDTSNGTPLQKEKLNYHSCHCFLQKYFWKYKENNEKCHFFFNRFVHKYVRAESSKVDNATKKHSPHAYLYELQRAKEIDISTSHKFKHKFIYGTNDRNCVDATRTSQLSILITSTSFNPIGCRIVFFVFNFSWNK